jgi:hypothetical protein
MRSNCANLFEKTLNDFNLNFKLASTLPRYLCHTKLERNVKNYHGAKRPIAST